MSTENDNKQVAVKAQLRAGGQVMAIIPQDIDQVWRLAGMAVMGQMAPESLTKGKDFDAAQAACAIAIMAGAELGMTPLTALRSYAVVNGRPSLWGDGIKSVVRSSGKCEFIRAGGDLTKGWCEAKRKDTGEEMRREFTWEQAKKANLTGKAGPWQQYPDMMMERRATFRCLNDLFADVLGGLSDASDPVDPEDMRDVTPAAARPLPPPVPEDEPEAVTIEPEKPVDPTPPKASRARKPKAEAAPAPEVTTSQASVSGAEAENTADVVTTPHDPVTGEVIEDEEPDPAPPATTPLTAEQQQAIAADTDQTPPEVGTEPWWESLAGWAKLAGDKDSLDEVFENDFDVWSSLAGDEEATNNATEIYDEAIARITAAEERKDLEAQGQQSLLIDDLPEDTKQAVRLGNTP